MIMISWFTVPVTFIFCVAIIFIMRISRKSKIEEKIRETRHDL